MPRHAQHISYHNPLSPLSLLADMEEMVSWIEKGFHLESSDGRKHTALSEAACQGHVHIVEYLLAEGADPNVRSDTGRSAIWRAAFGGHVEVSAAVCVCHCSECMWRVLYTCSLPAYLTLCPSRLNTGDKNATGGRCRPLLSRQGQHGKRL
jgi:hypothetical protein